MVPFLKLIRWQNLLIIALTQLLIKHALLEPFEAIYGVNAGLSEIYFCVLVFSTLCIAAGGYVINDIYDIETDKINKPNNVIVNNTISEKNAFTLFIILNIIGVGLGFYLSNAIGKSALFVLFFASSALLYIYATALKQMLLIGNLVISLVVALSILIVGVFELFPVMTLENRTTQILFFRILIDYAIFAFLINLLREIVKDIEDINGDYKLGMQTLPIVIGRQRTTNIAFGLCLLILAVIIYYVITYFFQQLILVGYFLVLVIAPLLYAALKLFNAEEKSEYQHISKVLKIVMLTGIGSMLLYKFVLL